MGISPEELVDALVAYCKGYTEEIREKVGDGLESIGAEAVSEVKDLSPVYEGDNKNTPRGAYRRNWEYLIEKERGKINVIVHVKGKHYRLTHLLEHGHLTRNGTSRAKAVPHISIAQEHAEKKVDKLLEGL